MPLWRALEGRADIRTMIRTFARLLASASQPALLCSLLASLLGGCQSYERQPLLGNRSTPFPIQNFVGVRALRGYRSPPFQESYARGLQKRVQAWRMHGLENPTYEILVLGAGGPNGAFGAGLMSGWTASGKRPVFDVVTGVSAGAILAPFAFIGAAVDEELKDSFRELRPSDIYEENGVMGSLLGESLMNSNPLQALINSHADQEFLRAVAQGHRNGRRLYVGTTNFDMGQMVIWDLGAIAVHETDEALQLFRKVLLASASIPVFYPPVLFETEDAEGNRGDEMHVDGAVARPMFLPNQVCAAWQAASEAGVEEFENARFRQTVIHNGSLLPIPEAVPRETVDIATRAYLMAAWFMVQDNVLHLYLMSRVWNADFRFVCIPDDGEVNVMEFSEADTRRLYDQGREIGLHPDTWPDSPPGYLVPDELRAVQPLLR